LFEKLADFAPLLRVPEERLGRLGGVRRAHNPMIGNHGAFNNHCFSNLA
jgi:hypothetical protein